MCDLIVDTKYGKVQGVKKLSSLNVEYNAFLGIPFATPPIGGLRFKDPLPPVKWNGVYDATYERPGCYEYSTFFKKIMGSEDSLILNVFTKNVNPTKPYPVMVYIYGGAFNNGSSSLDMYGPDFIMMADVILVTLNYRTGAFGFMTLKDEKLNIPGNAGLKDQRLALEFVKENIVNFGGDPENITLIGQSAGGASVSWHCVSERSKGLFNRAIAMSGCVFNRWSLTPHRDWAYRLALKLGYDGSEDESVVLDFLQKADPEKIVEFQKLLLRPEEKSKIDFSFAPHIESFVTEDTFITAEGIQMSNNAWSNDIDILIGGTQDEGIMYLEMIKSFPAILEHFDINKVIPLEVGVDVSHPSGHEFVESLKKIYYPTRNEPTKDDIAFCKVKTDEIFWHGLQRTIQSRQNSSGSGKTFLYKFAVDSPTQNHYRIRRLGPDVRGVCHGDEMSYLFKNSIGDVPEQKTIEFKTIQRFVSLITSFAATGIPNANILKNDDEGVEIKSVESKQPPFKGLTISESLSFDYLPEFERLAIWDQLYKSTGTPLY